MRRATKLAAVLAVGAASVVGYAGAAQAATHTATSRPQAVQTNYGYFDYWYQCEAEGHYLVTEGGAIYYFCQPDTKSDGYWLFVDFD
jgi:hypothetical protein